MTLAMLAVLVWLGVWQVHRLAWKTALLAALDRAEAGPAVALGPAPSPFAKVRITGRYLTEARGLYGVSVHDAGDGQRIGADLLMPLARDDGPPVLVDRGWVPEERTLPPRLPQPPGTVTVEGYVRPAAHPGLFSPSDDPAARHFYTLDPAAIGAALGAPGLAPFTLIALGPPPAGRYPEPARHLPRPDNNHLSYAITWFGLAAALLIVFAVWARKAIRA